MEIMSKIFICVINIHCLGILDSHRTKYQFCGTPKIGCSDGLITTKTLLNMINNHNLPNFVYFVDLVNTFDTAGHNVLRKLL